MKRECVRLLYLMAEDRIMRRKECRKFQCCDQSPPQAPRRPHMWQIGMD